MKVKTLVLIVLAYLGIKLFYIHLNDKNIGKLVFYDVGQGDAALISTTDGKKMLIDGGPDFEISAMLADDFVINSCFLDYVLLTHPHADHLKGLTRVINNCALGKLLLNDINYASKLYQNFMIDADKIGHSPVFTEDTFMLGVFKLYVFWPERSELEKLTNPNNMSVVVLLDYGNFEALFTGDLEKEYLLRLNYEKMRSLIQDGLDVLKVPHHGSIDSLEESLYTKLQPKICVISVGLNNKYGHPSTKVLEFLRQSNCKIRRTDLEGTIEILLDKL